MALAENGDVYGWGSNSRGKFGISEGTKEELYVPEQIKALKMIKTLACGTWHVLALDHSGKVFSSGSNKNFELGREGGDGDGFLQITSKMEKSSQKSVQDIEEVHVISAGFGVSLFAIGEER